MAFIRTPFLILVAILAPVVASFAYFILSHVSAGLRLAAIMASTESCQSPEAAPKNTGVQVVSDLRQPGSGTVFPDLPIDMWADEQSRKIAAETDPARDLVIYVHGFRSTLADATCAGEVLRADLAALPDYAADGGPDILVFGWPGEFRPWQFTAAQGSAERSGAYLSEILNELSGRRVFIVAHSLGARVTMVAADRLVQHNDAPPLAGILLVGGAIPAVSVREWSSTFTLTFPALNLDDLRNGRPTREPLVEITTGRGSLVAAAAKASHLVVTTAGADIPLGSAFLLDESFQPSDLNRPLIPPDFENFSKNDIDLQAIGTPFPTGKIYRRYDEVLPDPFEDLYRHTNDIEPDLSNFRPVDPSRVLSRSEWVFDFHVPHPSYHEIRLDQGQWWRLLRDWHGIMTHAGVRHDILSKSWAVFNQLRD